MHTRQKSLLGLFGKFGLVSSTKKTSRKLNMTNSKDKTIPDNFCVTQTVETKHCPRRGSGNPCIDCYSSSRST